MSLPVLQGDRAAFDCLTPNFHELLQKIVLLRERVVFSVTSQSTPSSGLSTTGMKS